MKKYGKKCGDISKIKDTFFAENERLLQERNYIADVYRKQPMRKNCKLCGNSLNIGDELQFISHKIVYKICSFCHHVNGIYDDTSQFSEVVYRGQDYGQTYSEKSSIDYLRRKELIYLPKVQFMEEVLEEKSRILEIGAGSGYFSDAANDEGYDILGIEISERQVEFANNMTGKSLCQCVAVDKIADVIRQTDREAIVAIGVLEHIFNMQEILRAICGNINIKYFYFSVPLFSFSVFLEMVFQGGFNRQLGGGAHTSFYIGVNRIYESKIWF